MGKASPLREAVKTRFYPFAASRGFARIKSDHPLFMTFQRATDETLHVFEVHWDKRGAPCFVIHFSELPATGIDARGVHIDTTDIRPLHGATLGALQPRNGPYVRDWFRLKKPWLGALLSRSRFYSPDQVVDQLLALFPEVEAWWAEKREGPHLRFIRRG